MRLAVEEVLVLLQQWVLQELRVMQVQLVLLLPEQLGPLQTALVLALEPLVLQRVLQQRSLYTCYIPTKL